MDISHIDGNIPSQLIQLIEGRYFWKYRPEHFFKNTGSFNGWNKKHALKPVSQKINRDGYAVMCIFNKRYLAHRLIWAIHYNNWPNGDIDHINGIRTDNDISNLRVVSRLENNRNASVRKDNTSGRVGVSWSKKRQKWLSQIKIENKNLNLGFFDDKLEAVLARNQAEKLYGFHQNHGKIQLNNLSR